MISCADFIAELGSYMDGGIQEEVRQQLEAHVAHCQTCQIVLDSARKTVTVVTESGSFDLPDTAFKPIAAKIMARIRNERPSD